MDSYAVLPSARRSAGFALSAAEIIASTVRPASPLTTKLPSAIARRTATAGVSLQRVADTDSQEIDPDPAVTDMQGLTAGQSGRAFASEFGQKMRRGRGLKSRASIAVVGAGRRG